MKKIKIIVRSIIFVIIGIIIFFLITPIFIPKTINSKLGYYMTLIRGFYQEPKDSLDVIFSGDSCVYKGITPLKIWKEYGIAGYNFASPTQRIWDSYYCIKEALKYQKPKVIVLNVDQIFTEYPMVYVHKRNLYDNMNLGEAKIEGIMDKVQENGYRKTVSYILPLFTFHSRWSELEKEDFLYAYKNSHYPFKGYQITTINKPYKNGNGYIKKENKSQKIGQKGKLYLEKIIELCKQNNIELLLIEIPSPNTWNKTKHNIIQEIANINKVPFIDLNTKLDELKFDWNTDTEDETAYHLNKKGAEKVSNYLGNYLVKNYQLISHKNENGYEKWNMDLKEYEEYGN